jgi:hypothetical protein
MVEVLLRFGLAIAAAALMTGAVIKGFDWSRDLVPLLFFGFFCVALALAIGIP